MIEAKVIADSISNVGKRITTFQVKFHRFILPEFNTHRVFSRNFSSSRAIPTKKLLEQVLDDPAIPVHWGKNQPGMQANEELTGEARDHAKNEWFRAANSAVLAAHALSITGAHKQIVNRVIEPFMWVHGIVTSTEWDNFFELRDHPDAQPEIHELAIQMKNALNNSSPRLLEFGEWHLPYITEQEKHDAFFTTNEDITLLRKISAARCCRVSYLKHDGNVPSINDDIALFNRLAESRPIHASPLEHQATPIQSIAELHLQGNFKEWVQYRKVWEKHIYQ